MKTLAAGSYFNFSPSKFRNDTTSTTTSTNITVRSLAFVGHQNSLGPVSLSFISSQRFKICCLSALPSEITDEDEEIQETNTDQQKTVHVRFALQKQCGFGEQFLIVGDDPVLASWNPSGGVPLNWSEGHVWTVELDLPSGKVINYKFLLEAITGSVSWQPGPDRILETWDTDNVITVFEDWDNPELQNIVESDASEESVISAGLLTVDENLSPDFEEDENDLGKEVEDTNSYATKAYVSTSAPLVAENILLAEKDLSTSDKTFKSDTDNKMANFSNLVRPDDEPKLVYDEGKPVLVPGLASVESEETEEASPINGVKTDDDDDAESVSNSANEVEELTVPDETTEAQQVSTSSQKPPETTEQMLETKAQVHDNVETIETKAEVYVNEEMLETKAQVQDNEETLEMKAQVQDNEEMIETKAEVHVNEETLETKAQVDEETFETKAEVHDKEEMLETKPQEHDNEETENSIIQSNMQWGRQTIQKFLACLGF